MARIALLSLAALLGLAVGCNSGDGGISVAVACDIYSDKVVECESDDPLNDDNYKQAGTVDCENRIATWKDANPDNRACDLAVREWHRCLGVEWSCEDLSNGQTEDICQAEAIDIIESCDNFVEE